MSGQSSAMSREKTLVRPDDQRVRAVVTEHHALAWRLVRRFGVPVADAEDAVQRVFVVVARRLSEIEIGRERAFIVSTATRVAADMRRSARRKPLELLPEVEAEHVSAAPDELAASSEARRMLDALLADMPEDVRGVFVLFEIEELTFTEIAVVLSIPRGTVASRHARGRAWFQAELARRQHAFSRKEGEP